jgi:hypothetical protein
MEKKTINETIKDSGSMREFSTGAHRDNATGKGRCDLLPLRQVAYLMADENGNPEPVIINLANFMDIGNVNYLYAALREGCEKLPQYTCLADMMLEASKLYEAGAAKYGENNWKRGIPVSCYIDSGTRHYLKTLRGDDDEPHYRGFAWNLLCAIWSVENNPDCVKDMIIIE